MFVGKLIKLLRVGLWLIVIAIFFNACVFSPQNADDIDATIDITNPEECPEGTLCSDYLDINKNTAKIIDEYVQGIEPSFSEKIGAQSFSINGCETIIISSYTFSWLCSKKESLLVERKTETASAKDTIFISNCGLPPLPPF